MLSAEHNGTQLSKPLIAMTANYLVEVVEVDDVNQIMKKTLQKTFEEAWADNKDGADLPAMHAMSIASWLAAAAFRASFWKNCTIRTRWPGIRWSESSTVEREASNVSRRCESGPSTACWSDSMPSRC